MCACYIYIPCIPAHQNSCLQELGNSHPQSGSNHYRRAAKEMSKWRALTIILLEAKYVNPLKQQTCRDRCYQRATLQTCLDFPEMLKNGEDIQAERISYA